MYGGLAAITGATGSVDAAIAGVLFQAGLRRSEAAALEWRDVAPASIPGAVTITVRQSKTNRDGSETDIRLVKNGAAAALSAIRPDGVEPTAKVFGGLTGQSKGRRFTRAAEAAGVEGVTAHGGRVGLASALTEAGASTTETMLAGGWKTARMVSHYSAGRSRSISNGFRRVDLSGVFGRPFLCPRRNADRPGVEGERSAHIGPRSA